MPEIQELINDIRTIDLVLPEFQREYVWTREQAKQLVSSLIKGYPVGGLLLWKTTDPPDLKNVQKESLHTGTYRVILDGQQRLTTLFMLVAGEIPPYYTKADVQNDPRDLYFNLETGELHYYQVSRMRDNPVWQRVTDCFRISQAGTLAFEIAEQKVGGPGQEAYALAQTLTSNLDRLRSITKQVIPEQVVPVTATLDEAIDIFDLVNSQGTKLTEAELALTHITGKWSQARRIIKAKLDDLGTRHFKFDLTFMTRALTAIVTQRALFETIHTRERSDVEAGWKRLSKILDYLSNFLPTKAYIHSTEDLSTTNALIPLIVYLDINGGRFPSQASQNNAIHWLYTALMKARYTAQTDQRLEKDVAIVVRELTPWETLLNQIEDQRGRLDVQPNDFEGRGIGHPLFKIAHIIAKARGAIDWQNGLALGKPHGDSYKIHKHHIFPINYLREKQYDEDSHIHNKIVNEIANRAFITAETNWGFSDTPPHEYLPIVEERYPGALGSQFVPMDPALWHAERFETFLTARRKLMSDAINEYLAHLVTEQSTTATRPLREVIASGESTQLEFKSSLQWDVRNGQVNRALLHAVVKSIAAFMNTEGGTLIIGLEDSGVPFGIESDILALGGSRDKFEQRLVRLVADSIGTEYAYLVKLRFEDLEGKQVCVVEVAHSPEPIFTKGPDGQATFFVRTGNATRSLNPEETTKYVAMAWQ